MSSLKKRILFLLYFGGIANFTMAQTTFSTLQDIWNYADKHNIQIQTAIANNKIAGKSVKQAYGALLPSVTANGNFTDNVKIQPTLIPLSLFNSAAPTGKYEEVTFGKRYIYNGNIMAQWDILNTQNKFSLKAAKLNEEIASLNITKTKKDLYDQLANAYFSFILLTEAEKLSQENVKTTTEIYTAANNKFIDGLISEPTLNTALINKEKVEKSLDAAVQNKALQLNNLKILLNISDSIFISEKLVDQKGISDTGQLVEDPAVELAHAQVLVSKNEWLSSKAAFAPSLSAVYQYNKQIQADDFLKFSNSYTTPQQYWGLRLAVPIFTGNTRRYEIQKTKIDYDIKQLQYNSTRLQTNINNQNLLIAYNTSLKAFEKSKNILALYQSNDLHAERKLKEGVISFDDRLKSYSDLISNQNEYLQSMSDYLIQEYTLLIRQTNIK